MKRLMKKFFFVFAIAALAFASCSKDDTDYGTVSDSGTIGSLSWTMYDSGTLVISGQGNIDDMDYNFDNSPWWPYNQTTKQIIIKRGIMSIGNFAFVGFSSVREITLPAGLTDIGYEAFEGCLSLTGITLPASLTNIGTFCSGCTALTDIDVAAGNPQYTSENGVVFNKKKTELICYPTGKQGNYVVPDGVTSIGDFAFAYCNNLIGITLPTNLTNIENSAFSMCISLTSITLPSGLISIEDSAFSGCSALTEIALPASLTSLGDWAFSGCTALTSVTLPEELTNIEYQTFYDCPALTNVTCLAETPPKLDDLNFQGINATLYVPANCVAAYQTSKWGLLFATITAIPE